MERDLDAVCQEGGIMSLEVQCNNVLNVDSLVTKLVRLNHLKKWNYVTIGLIPAYCIEVGISLSIFSEVFHYGPM